MPVSVNLRDLLAVCVRSALAAQQYIALDLLQLPKLQITAEGGSRPSSILELSEGQKQELLRSLNESVAVDVKGELAYKEGEASHDLVTTADVLTQAVVVKALSTAFPDTPFTIVGEEEADAAETNADIAARMEYCLRSYYNDQLALPCAAQFAAHVAKQTDAVAATAAGVITADSIDALRERVSVYIDPIDGTNCFVTGVWQSPMMLVGITVDGEPLAAVINRVFLYPIGKESATGTEAASQPPTESISYVWNVIPDVAGSSFMVHEGQQVPLHAGKAHPCSEEKMDDKTVLCVTQSSTTKASFLAEIGEKLQPSEAVFARGAGNKLFTLIEKTLSQGYGVEQRRFGDPVHADVFICPGHTIKKWDTCAPHAFLATLGGDIYSQHGTPLRYPFKHGDDPHAPAFTDLPEGIVATRQESKQTVARRLGWAGSHY